NVQRNVADGGIDLSQGEAHARDCSRLWDAITPSPCMQGEGWGEGAFCMADQKCLPHWKRRTLSPALSLSTGRGRKARLRLRPCVPRFLSPVHAGRGRDLPKGA